MNNDPPTNVMNSVKTEECASVEVCEVQKVEDDISDYARNFLSKWKQNPPTNGSDISNSPSFFDQFTCEPLQSSSPPLSGRRNNFRRDGKKNRRMNIEPFYSKPKIIQAIVKADVHTIRHLLSSGAENVNGIDSEKRSHLHLAAALGNVEVVKLLITAKARVNVRDDNFLTPLHRACRNNNDEVVKLLIEAGANIDDRDRNCITPLHVCAANNSLECVKLFMDQITNKNVTDRNGSTALHHAANNGNCDMITYLLKMGCSPNSQDKMGRRPLHYAAATGNNDAIAILLGAGAKINAIDSKMMTPLLLASDSGQLVALQTLLDNGANIRSTDREGNNSLHIASANGHDEIVEELLLKDPDLVCTPNVMQLTPLHFASGSPKGSSAFDHLTTDSSCLERINFNCKDKLGRTPLHFAAKFGRLSRVQELIRLGADVKSCDKNMMSAFHYAVQSAHVPILDVFLSIESFDPSDVIDSSGMTGLHHASFLGLSSVVQHLINHSTKPFSSELLDITGRPPHFLACMGGSLECFKLLFKHNLANILDNFDRSPLHYAAASSLSSSYDCLEYLLKMDLEDGSPMFNVNQKDIFGRCPIHYAAEFDPDNDGSKIELLINNCAQIDVVDINGLYPINYASAAGNVKTLKILITTFYHGDIEFKVCPSQLACYYSRPQCLELLLDACIFNDLVKSMEISAERSPSCRHILEQFVTSYGSSDDSNISVSSGDMSHSIASRRSSETRNVDEQIKRLSDIFRLKLRSDSNGSSEVKNCDDELEPVNGSQDLNSTADSEYFTADELSFSERLDDSPIKPMNGHHVETAEVTEPKSVNWKSKNGSSERALLAATPDIHPLQLDFNRSQVLSE